MAETLSAGEYTTQKYRDVWHALEECYGGEERFRQTLFKQIEKFPKIKKFNRSNIMSLENLLRTVMREFEFDGVLDPGGIINGQVKKLIPEDELNRYFRKLPRGNDNLREF